MRRLLGTILTLIVLLGCGLTSVTAPPATNQEPTVFIVEAPTRTVAPTSSTMTDEQNAIPLPTATFTPDLQATDSADFQTMLKQQTPGPAFDGTWRILPLGDSITELTYRYDLWKQLIDAGISFEFVGSLESIPSVCYSLQSVPNYAGRVFDGRHEGHAGWRSDEIVDGKSEQPNAGRLSDWLQTYTPDIVLLHIGTNDAWQYRTGEETPDHIRRTIALVQQRNPNVTIFLAKLIPLDEETRGPIVETINQTIDTIATQTSTATSQVIVVDHFSDFDGVVDTCDGIHPNASGNIKMANRWADVLIPYLGNR